MKLKIALIFLFFISCNKDQAKIFIEQKVDTELILPQNIVSLEKSGHYYNDERYYNTIKIVHFFNGDCGYCVENLTEWMKYVESLKNMYEIDFIFLSYTRNEIFLKENVFEKAKFDNPLFIVDQKDFISLNKIPENRPDLCTFLIIEDKIKVIGDPIINSQIKLLYEEQILQFLNCN